MKQKQVLKMKNISIGFALFFSLTILLVGCADQDDLNEPEIGSIPEASQSLQLSETDAQVSKADTPIFAKGVGTSVDTANLDAVVIQMLEDGVTARPTITTDMEGSGQVAEQRLGDDDGTDITVKFTAATIFQVQEVDRSTYSFQILEGTREDVKKDSSLYVWGIYNGPELTADRVAVVRFV